MKRKWLRLAASALALAGAALAGCGQQADRPPEYPIVQPTQTDGPVGTATAAPMQPATPASTATPEPTRSPEASATGDTATATLAPAGQANTEQASKDAVEKAKADLAKKLGLPISEIAVVVVVGQEFSTNAFYCRAAKDRIAKDDSPAAISGLSILLKASGRRYEYHASGQTVIFCRPLA